MSGCCKNVPSQFDKMRANRERRGSWLPKHRRELIDHIERLRDEVEEELYALHGPLEDPREEQAAAAPSPEQARRYQDIFAKAVAEEASTRRRWWQIWRRG